MTTELENRDCAKISAIEQRAVVDLRDLEQKFERLTRDARRISRDGVRSAS